MKQTIRMNEAELNRLISESVMRVLNEGMDEEMDEYNIINGINNTFGALKKSLTDGGTYSEHKGKLDYDTHQKDHEKLKAKYNGGNLEDIKKSMGVMKPKNLEASIAPQIEQLEKQKQEKIQQITAKYNQKIEATRTKAAQKNASLLKKAEDRNSEYKRKMMPISDKKAKAKERALQPAFQGYSKEDF